MGMDVHGLSPTAEVGRYFRRSVWSWRPLARYINDHCSPHLVSQCKHWFTNDGDGLRGKQAVALAAELHEQLACGAALHYVGDRNAALAALPRVECQWCEGTGVRRDGVGRQMGMPDKVIDTPGHPRYGHTGWCNACSGVGNRADDETMYVLTVDDIRAFADFCAASGGFEIY